MFSGTSSCCLKSVFFLIKTFWHRPQLALECCSGLRPWLRSRGKGPHPLGPTTLSPSFQAAQAFSGNVLPSHHQPQVLQKNDHSLWLPCCRGGSRLHLLTPGPAQISPLALVRFFLSTSSRVPDSDFRLLPELSCQDSEFTSSPVLLLLQEPVQMQRSLPASRTALRPSLERLRTACIPAR